MTEEKKPFSYLFGNENDIVEFDPSTIETAGVRLSLNNSGGKWWLKENDELGLKNAGWKVNIAHGVGGRHVAHAFLIGADIETALKSFRQATHFTGRELGCNCCGVPFSFVQYSQEGKWLKSYSTSYPDEGEDYEG